MNNLLPLTGISPRLNFPACASASMEIAVDIVGNVGGEDTALQKTADPVVYQLVRVDGDGRLVPATDDEVIAVENLLEVDQSKNETPDNGLTIECGTSYECGPCALDKDDAEKPKMAPITAVDSEETNVQQEQIITTLIPNTSDDSVSQFEADDNKTSNSPLGMGLKPDFSLLNGEIDLDNLSVKDLQETFKATFGRETSVKNKQWLQRRIIMGLTNSCDFSTTTFVVIDDIVVKKGNGETCETEECPVMVDCVVESCDDKLNETSTIGNQMQIQGSCFQGNCESRDSDTEQRPAKRVRKPTKRYIEEFSEEESRDSSAKTVPLVKDPENDNSSAKVCARPVLDAGLDGRCLIRKDSLGGSGIQVPYVSRIRRSRPRENFMTLMKFQPIDLGISSRLETNGDSSSEQFDSESGNKLLKNSVSSRWTQEPAVASSERFKPCTEKKTIQLEREVKPNTKESYKTSGLDDELVTVSTANGGLRRKHHRPWTLSEVVKLVEGVAKYGAGRWSEIKRLVFASYSYRTSVDLKDKWRNLLRASLADPSTGNGIPSSRKQNSVPIPAPILSRVRELADIQAQVLPSPVSGKLSCFKDSNRAVHKTTSGFL